MAVHLPLPAFCYRCMQRFDAPIWLVEDVGGSITVKDCTTICPFCRSVTRIPDGDYTFESLALGLAERANRRQRKELEEALERFDPGEGVEALSQLVSRVNGPWDELAAHLHRAAERIPGDSAGAKAANVGRFIDGILRALRYFRGA